MNQASNAHHENNQGLHTVTHRHVQESNAKRIARAQQGDSYHRRAAVVCIIPGEIDEGGLATRMPVLGFTIGMAFRVRIADGWWILRLLLLLAKLGGTTYAEAAADDRDSVGATC